MVSRGVTPAGNNSVLRTGLGGTQSATLRINRRPAYRNLSPSILHSKRIIFHSSPPRSPCPRFPPAEPLNTVRRGGLAFLQPRRALRSLVAAESLRDSYILAYGWRMESMRRKRLVFVPRSMLKI